MRESNGFTLLYKSVLATKSPQFRDDRAPIGSICVLAGADSSLKQFCNDPLYSRRSFLAEDRVKAKLAKFNLLTLWPKVQNRRYFLK